MRAQQHAALGAGRAAGYAGAEQVAATSSLLDVAARARRSSAAHAGGDRASRPDGLGDRAELGEALVQPPALDLGRAAARRYRPGGRALGRPRRRWRGSPSRSPTRRALAGAPQRGRDELAEQRRRALGPRLELRVELRGDEERVRRGSSMTSTRRSSGEVPDDDQAGGLEPLAQADRHLVAVAVALVDDGLAVDLARPRAGVELDRVGAQAHRAAEVGDLLLLGQQVDDRPLGLEVELGRVGALHAGDVAGELADRDLHAEADAEVRDPLLARDLRGADLALDAAAAEAAGDEDAVGAAEALRGASSSVSSVSESTQSISTSAAVQEAASGAAPR